MQIARTDYLPWKKTYVVPVGDVQLGAGGVDLDTLRRDIERGLEHDAWFIGMGDYVDVASPSGRRKILAAGFYDSVVSALEGKAEEHIDEFLKVVEGTEGRWLGLLQGHHYYEFGDGTTSDTRSALMS